MMKNLKILFFICALVSLTIDSVGQSNGRFNKLTSTTLGVGSNSINASSVVDFVSTTKGFLAPRMTTAERTAIAAPATGLMVFNTDLVEYEFYNGVGWAIIGSSNTWATVLANGATSGGTNPQIADGDSIEFLSGISTGYIMLPGALAGDREWGIPSVSGTITLGTGTVNKVVSWAGTNTVGDGTWEFSGNTILPTTDHSNIGVNGTNRVLTMFIDSIIEMASKLLFVEGGGGLEVGRFDVNGALAIGTTGSADASALLEVKSTAKGFLAPRMTTIQKDAIGSPATGLLVFDTDLGVFQYFETTWKHIGSGGGIYAGSGSLSGATVVTMGSDNLTLSGDPTGGILFKLTNTGIGNADMIITSSGQVAEFLSNGDLAFAGNASAHTATPDMFIEKTTGEVGIGNVVPAGLLDISKAVIGTPSTVGKYLSFSTSTFTDNNTAGSGTAAEMVFNSIAAPTLAATNLTVTTTDASTFYIAGAPIEGTNMTITNPYSLWVDDGDVRLDEDLVVDTVKALHYGGQSDFSIGLAGEEITLGGTITSDQTFATAATIFYFRSSLSGTSGTHNNIRGRAQSTAVGASTSDIRGVYGQGITNAGLFGGAITGVFANAIAKGTSTTTNVRGLFAEAETEATPTAVTNLYGAYVRTKVHLEPVTDYYGVMIDNEKLATGFVADAYLGMKSTTWGAAETSADYGIDMNSITKIGTADLRLHNGALIANTETDTLFLTETTVKISSELHVPYADVDSINIDGTTVDTIIQSTDFTGNLANSIANGDTAFFGVFQSDIAAGELRFTGATSATISGVSPFTIDVTGTGNAFAEVIQDNNAGRFNVGRTTATEFSKLSITDGGADNEPGMLTLYDDGGTGHHLWMSTDNVLRAAAPEPTDDDADGFAIIDNDDGTIGASGQAVNGSTITGTTITDGTLTTTAGALTAAISVDAVDISTGITDNDPNWLTVKIFNDSTLTIDGSVASLLPAGYIIENIMFKETAGNSIIGFDIGFTAGGGEIVANGNITASDEGSFNILQRTDDFDAADTIFFDATNWNSANLIIYIKMSRIF